MFTSAIILLRVLGSILNYYSLHASTSSSKWNLNNIICHNQVFDSKTGDKFQT